MPKRTYPFEETFVMQQKILVGEKQVNEGVMKNKNMENIYDSTLKKLFSGMKRNMKSSGESEKVDVSSKLLKEISPNAQFKQMEINSSGKLTQPNWKSRTNLPDVCPIMVSTSCKDCNMNILNPAQQSHCSYCDCHTCDNCLKMCLKCSSGYCSSCSFIQYKEHDTAMNICLRCI